MLSFILIYYNPCREVIDMRKLSIWILAIFIVMVSFVSIVSGDIEKPNRFVNSSHYKRTIMIENPVNDYQLMINISKKYASGEIYCSNCRDDFGDVRFLNNDQTVYLDYWIEKVQYGNYAWFWVELPADIESNPQIVITYGNESMTSNSNGHETFLWFDDFSSDTSNNWERIEDEGTIGFHMYNTNYNSPISEGRLRSNLDCIDITSRNWGGRIFHGLKTYKDDYKSNFSGFKHTYNSDNGASNNQPASYLKTWSPYCNTEGQHEKIMTEGTNGYITETKFSSPSSTLQCDIWDSANNLLLSQYNETCISDNFNYIYFLLWDNHGPAGNNGSQSGISYDAIDEQLIIRCEGSYYSSNDAWLELHYSWMFLSKYVENEPYISHVGNQIVTLSPSDDTYIRMLSPTNNYGNYPHMYVRNNIGHPSHPEYWEHDTLVKFDIPELDIDQHKVTATLNLYYYDYADDNPSGRILDIINITSSWSENIVTWDTQPTTSSEFIDSAIVPSSPGWMSWDVSDEVFDIMLGSENNGWMVIDDVPYGDFDIPNIKFYSKEHITNTPYLEFEIEYLDVSQSLFDRGFPIRYAADGDWAGAQNFTATLNTLTGAQIYLRKFGNPEFNLTVELREDHPEGILHDTLVFIPEEIDSNWQWLTLNFNDIDIESDANLFIVCPPAPSGVTTSFGYEWGYAFGDQYQPGSFWFTRDGGDLWRDLPTSYEFVFRTYGYD